MESQADKIRTQKIAVLMGGKSSEREISLRSGNNILNALKRLGFDVIGIDVDDNLPQNLREQRIDRVFLALHGPYGEDGCVQGLLEIMEIPYTGSGVTASAICMDKILTKRVLAEEGLALPAYRNVSKKSQEELKECASEMGYPLILKPATEGSSIGIALVHTEEELLESFADLRRRFADLFLEQFIKGRELTVGAIVNGNDIRILPYLELKPDNEFYDFESKYTNGKTRFILSASFESQTKEKIDFSMRRAVRALNLKGVLRVDFIVDDKGVPWMLEINTIPGMTETSDIPQMAEAAGMNFDSVVLEILESSVVE